MSEPAHRAFAPTDEWLSVATLAAGMLPQNPTHSALSLWFSTWEPVIANHRPAIAAAVKIALDAVKDAKQTTSAVRATLLAETLERATP